VAHHKAIDQIRSRGRRAIPVADVPEQPVAGEPAAVSTELWNQVAALPPKQRAAVALRFLADLAYAEIGRVMETSEEAARRNVHEALKQLRKEQRR
jgi:RNA polymerase sigma factor (sigma-70 family)